MEKVTKKHGKCYHQTIRNGLILLAIGVFSKYSFGQGLPSQFITKVNYNEHKEVIFEAVDSNLINCLSMAEIAQFRSYEQQINVTEVVDNDGDLLSERVFMYEKNVHDDWMPDLNKVAVYKNHTYTSYKDGQEFLFERNTTNSTYFSLNDAENYELYEFDNNTLNDLKDDFINLEISYSLSGGIISSTHSYKTFLFDDNTKTTVFVEYDSNMVKLKETATSFYHIGSNIYIPSSEITIEWILSENGCCVKKTTIRTFVGFTRTSGNQQEFIKTTNNNSSNSLPAKQEVVNISKIEGENSILIKPIIDDDKTPYTVKIYDVTGKLLLTKTIIGNQKIELPQAVRTGMYLVHVFSGKNTTVSVGKIIATQNNQTF